MKENAIKVRKGIEKPLHIKGLTIRHFYLFFMLLMVSALFTMLSAFAALSGSITIGSCILIVVMILITLIAIYIALARAGKERKYNYKKTDAYINNINLLRDLKK